MSQPKLIYSPRYDIRCFGLEKLHPFDSCKYSRSYHKLSEDVDPKILKQITITPKQPASKDELLAVHTDTYLQQLNSSQYVASALELSLLANLPNSVQHQFVLAPMRYAVKGTILAAEAALNSGIGINLSGGYHHASKEKGEGFCIYSDIAIAISLLRKNGQLQPDDQVMIIDLDAHQGNGIERIFYDDPQVLIFDMYNQAIYPYDTFARERIDYDLPLELGTSDQVYLDLLKENLPLFLEKAGSAKIAFYNAGTDIYESDPLGALKISKQGILERDKFVFHSLLDANIPWAMTLSGGYTQESYQLVADSISYLVNHL